MELNMKAFTINHKNILKQKSNVVNNKPKILNYALDIKYKYPEAKEQINKIALNIQRKLNNNDLREIDIIEFAKSLEKFDIYCIDCYELISSLITIAKHQNSITSTKTNWGGWFGCVNKTNSMELFLNDLSIEGINQEDFKDIMLPVTNGIIKVNIGIAYTNTTIIESAIKDFTVAKLNLVSKNKIAKKWYNNLITGAEKLITEINQTYNHKQISFTRYLNNLLLRI